ncbi:MAG: MmgE/PrpD family protein [bacterium]|nr:MmgE/PrpD family protein [bacterium]MCM1374637.1 MmgE/PrpD family protein [Muribaculum sp.]
MLDSEVVERTKLFIADYYAACFAGYKVNRVFNRINLEYFKEMGGKGQASVLFDQVKFPAESAAYLNAMYAHGADMDDGNRISAGHIGTSVFSSVFALGEKLSVTWREILLAANVGYEVFNRIAGAAQPGLYQKGFHATGVAGGIAAGAACAKLLGLSEEGIYNAISLAALQASGLLVIDESGQACKPINAANAARIGVFSAVLAGKGLIGPEFPLESCKGWFNAFAEEIDENIIFQGLGTKFTISESYLKLYPTCRHTHSCIDAVLALRKRIWDTIEVPSQIQRIDIYTYPSAIRSAGGICRPRSAEEAKFSICYATAVALITGGFTLSDLVVETAGQEVWGLIDKIRIIEDASLENRQQGIRGANIRVYMENGKTEEDWVQIPRGEGKYLLTWEEMAEKVRMCADNVLLPMECDRLIENCRNVRQEDAFESISQLLNQYKREGGAV